VSVSLNTEAKGTDTYKVIDKTSLQLAKVVGDQLFWDSIPVCTRENKLQPFLCKDITRFRDGASKGVIIIEQLGVQYRLIHGQKTEIGALMQSRMFKENAFVYQRSPYYVVRPLI
jgi:hypothetical protein